MNAAKVGDTVIGICLCVPTPPGPFPATGIITTGSSMLTTTGLPIAITGSLVMFPCGTATIIASNPRVLDTALSVARTGDQVTGCATGTVVGTSQIMTF